MATEVRKEIQDETVESAEPPASFVDFLADQVHNAVEEYAGEKVPPMAEFEPPEIVWQGFEKRTGIFVDVASRDGLPSIELHNVEVLELLHTIRRKTGVTLDYGQMVDGMLAGPKVTADQVALAHYANYIDNQYLARVSGFSQEQIAALATEDSGNQPLYEAVAKNLQDREVSEQYGETREFTLPRFQEVVRQQSVSHSTALALAESILRLVGIVGCRGGVIQHSAQLIEAGNRKSFLKPSEIIRVAANEYGIHITENDLLNGGNKDFSLGHLALVIYAELVKQNQQ